jgi:hypothetical protein
MNGTHSTSVSRREGLGLEVRSEIMTKKNVLKEATMFLPHTRDILGLRRQVFGWAALAMVAAALLMPTQDEVQGPLERFKEEITGELKDLKEDVREEVASIVRMEASVYGYPLVMMDVTREVLTAAPAPNAEGTAAPINQLAKMPHYVDPHFKNVVRISLNAL